MMKNDQYSHQAMKKNLDVRQSQISSFVFIYLISGIIFMFYERTDFINKKDQHG